MAFVIFKKENVRAQTFAQTKRQKLSKRFFELALELLEHAWPMLLSWTVDDNGFWDVGTDWRLTLSFV